jgi:hypothetical protein
MGEPNPHDRADEAMRKALDPSRRLPKGAGGRPDPRLVAAQEMADAVVPAPAAGSVKISRAEFGKMLDAETTKIAGAIRRQVAKAVAPVVEKIDRGSLPLRKRTGGRS